MQYMLFFKRMFCKHNWQGYVFNGSGGSHIWCDKCGFEHYGNCNDKITKKAIKSIQDSK